MKMMNQIKRYATSTKTVVATGLMATAVTANAALPESVKTAIEGAKGDGLEAGWIVVGVAATLFVIKVVKRFF